MLAGAKPQKRRTVTTRMEGIEVLQLYMQNLLHKQGFVATAWLPPTHKQVQKKQTICSLHITCKCKRMVGTSCSSHCSGGRSSSMAAAHTKRTQLAGGMDRNCGAVACMREACSETACTDGRGHRGGCIWQKQRKQLIRRYGSQLRCGGLYAAHVSKTNQHSS
eukprot:scaffold220955_cov19-Tisochrysis_lutea.AAC.1